MYNRNILTLWHRKLCMKTWYISKSFSCVMFWNPTVLIHPNSHATTIQVAFIMKHFLISPTGITVQKNYFQEHFPKPQFWYYQIYCLLGLTFLFVEYAVATILIFLKSIFLDARVSLAAWRAIIFVNKMYINICFACLQPFHREVFVKHLQSCRFNCI